MRKSILTAASYAGEMMWFFGVQVPRLIVACVREYREHPDRISYDLGCFSNEELDEEFRRPHPGFGPRARR